jgi:two-component system nitrogen regulation response regulator GlnG
MSNVFDESTLTFAGESRLGGKGAGVVVPALTVLWHPDPARVGDILPLVAKKTAISRLQPVFSRPGVDGSGEPLADPYLSAKNAWCELELAADGAVLLRPVANGLELDCEAVPADGVVIAPERIVDGAVISVCRPMPRIVLCLHRVRIPIERGPKFGIVGESDAIERVRAQLASVLDLDVPVLVRGETGTGKELVARALAHEGPAPRLPFVAVNMASLTKDMAAAELFGHERGAFTGAVGQRRGAFLEADGGTLFLDEIALAAREVQHPLLRALQEGEVRPVGAARARKVNVRVVAATDADLERAVADGTFHEPLLHRFGVRITLPPLRERREDVGVLLVHLLRKHLRLVGEPDRLVADFSSQEGWLPASFVARVATRLPAGNVRGLENVARHVVIANRGRAKARVDGDVERLLRPVADARPPIDPTSDVTAHRTAPAPADLTATDLERALERSNWVFAGAAKALNVSRTTFYQLVEREGVARSAETIGEEEARTVFEELGGDLDAIAARFRTSRYALSQRLRELGILRGR